MNRPHRRLPPIDLEAVRRRVNGLPVHDLVGAVDTAWRAVREAPGNGAAVHLYTIAYIAVRIADDELWGIFPQL